MQQQPAILYSFRRCPYAMRARLALRYSQLQVELREVDLKNKPTAMLLASAKATVPVLICSNQKVIDESLEIMLWSLNQHDPQNWQQQQLQAETKALIDENDTQFKIDLDHYKYADRFPEYPPLHYRQQGELFLAKLEHRLKHTKFLLNNSVSLADIAIFPFIRQFAYVDIQWFETSPYINLQRWLNSWIESDLFQSIMQKQAYWKQP